MSVYYVWQVYDAGGWGMISGFLPAIGLEQVPLMARSREVAEKLRWMAEAHGRKSGMPIRLAVFEYSRTIVAIPDVDDSHLHLDDVDLDER